jgi:PPOX class probable F420-dependent enzyme
LNSFAALEGKRYLNLESYRRNGQGVRTPLWFAAAPPDSPGNGVRTLYAYTLANSGKAKRIRRNGAVMIAPCDARGKIQGPWVAARAEILDGAESARGMRLIDRKYAPWKQILDLSVLLLRRHQRIVLAIRAA